METTKTSARRLLAHGAAGAAIATTVNATIFGVARAADVDFLVDVTRKGPQHVVVANVVNLTWMSFAVGLVAAVIAGRIGPRSLRTVQIVGSILALLTIIPDFTIDGPASATLSLASMHVVAGFVFVTAVARARRVSVRPAVPLAPTPVEALAV